MTSNETLESATLQHDMTLSPEPKESAPRQSDAQKEWVLVVDDNEAILKTVALSLRQNGFEHVKTCSDSRLVMSTLDKLNVSVVLLDLTMPHVPGQKVLDQIRDRDEKLPVIILTGETDIHTVIDCLRRRATDYLVKPAEPDLMAERVRKVLARKAIDEEVHHYRETFTLEELSSPDAFANILTKDEVMIRRFVYLEGAAIGSDPILITGETGTGKELIARATHAASGRTGKFVAVNVAEIDENLLNSELFGHVKGAFTGAVSDKDGLLKQAANGTLFLDEIGDLSSEGQVRLLRFLEQPEYRVVGSTKMEPNRARIVAATLKDIDELREDLKYRFIHRVKLPPLRERLGDLRILVDHFLTLATEKADKRKPTVPQELFPTLENFHFPGNVRELRNMIFRSVAGHHRGIMSLEPFNEYIEEVCRENEPPEPTTAKSSQIAFPFPMPDQYQLHRAAVLAALERSEDSKAGAARMLKISRPTVNAWLEGRPKKKKSTNGKKRQSSEGGSSEGESPKTRPEKR